MTPIDREPTRLSVGLSVCAALIALAASGLFSWFALTAGTVGVVMLVSGVINGSYSSVSSGSFVLFGGAVLAGIQGAPVLPVVVGAAATVVAWNTANNAISIGTQLGRDARTARIEVVHAATTAGVGVLAAAIAFGVYRSVTGGQPVTALVFALIAAILLLGALD